jgi:hypothetical protein
MKRAWFVTLAVVILTAACSSNRPSTSAPHAMDPRSLSKAELYFGVSPSRDEAVKHGVKYQDNVVIMEQGAKAIRSVSADGLTWTFDANAPQVREIEAGKIVFATSRAVGRVLAVQRSGSNASVVFGPVEITEVIKEAHMNYDQPLDLQSMVAYTAPTYPGAVSDVDKLTADASGGDEWSIATAVLSPSGDVTPVSFVSRPASSRRGPDAWTDADIARVRFMQQGPVGGGLQLPSAGKAGQVQEIPGFGPPGPLDIADFKVGSFCCGGLGVQVSHKDADLDAKAYAVLRLNHPSLKFKLDISPGAAITAMVELNGGAGLTLHVEATDLKGLARNINKGFYVPVDLSLNIANLGVPFAVTIHQQFRFQTAFTANNSTLSSTGDYTFSGLIYMGLDKGQWNVGAPTQLHMNSSLGQSLQGVSLGATAMLFGMEGRIIVGIGAFGFVTGPYVGYSATAGLVRGSDLVTGLVGITCRGSELNLNIDAGIGYQIAEPVRKAINFFVATINRLFGTSIEEIKSFGGLKFTSDKPLWHNASDNPKGCAGFK